MAVSLAPWSTIPNPNCHRSSPREEESKAAGETSDRQPARGGCVRSYVWPGHDCSGDEEGSSDTVVVLGFVSTTPLKEYGRAAAHFGALNGILQLWSFGPPRRGGQLWRLLRRLPLRHNRRPPLRSQRFRRRRPNLLLLLLCLWVQKMGTKVVMPVPKAAGRRTQERHCPRERGLKLYGAKWPLRHNPLYHQ
jgi:hypothetical protein